MLNSNGFAQSYHQFGISYRENFSKRLAFGLKLNFLSGITYNKIEVNNSSLFFDQQDNMNFNLSGNYRSSFLRAKAINRSTFLPNFKNPGVSHSFGTRYNAKSGVFIMANIRFINSDRRKGFYTATNAKADFMISRKYDFYTPALIVSKNLFYQGGEAAFANSFYSNFSVSLTATFNLNGFAMLGTQGMYQTPNFELFLGTDNLLKSTTVRQKATATSGYYGGSIYMDVGTR